MTYRILYVNGPGDTIKHWSQDQSDPRSITFLSQFRDFCRALGAEAYLISYHCRKAHFRDGPFVLEHRPKPMPGASGIRYHFAQAAYVLGLFLTAVRYRADAAVLESGTGHYFMLSIFKVASIKVVVVLHNTLWPAGFSSTRSAHRFIAKLDSVFFRWIPMATIAVSPECSRQVTELTKGRHRPIYQIRAHFHREYFQAISPPPRPDQTPFRILYSGRITRDKGVFDILEMATRIEARRSGQAQWEIHGVGPDLEELARLQSEMGLSHIVLICGWTPPERAREVYARSHVCIVPTRSTFCEGMPMTAIESVLAGRPVITSRVSPALEVLRPACVEARTDDVDSYVEQILGLIDDPDRYNNLCRACPDLQEQFYDPGQGFTAALAEAFSAHARPNDRAGLK